jgi:hypothetical protein
MGGVLMKRQPEKGMGRFQAAFDDGMRGQMNARYEAA